MPKIVVDYADRPAETVDVPYEQIDRGELMALAMSGDQGAVDYLNSVPEGETPGIES